jgi:hypothetical protein
MRFTMRFTIATLISAFALSATASSCPVFNGTYQCEGDGIEQELTLKTEIVSGVTQYSWDDTQIRADGQYRKVAFMGGEYDMAASCQKETLTINVVFDGGEGDNEDCGKDKWNLLYTLNFTPNGQNISETHSSSTVCANGKVIPSEARGSMSCIKRK